MMADPPKALDLKPTRLQSQGTIDLPQNFPIFFPNSPAINLHMLVDVPCFAGIPSVCWRRLPQKHWAAEFVKGGPNIAGIFGATW